MAVLLVDLEHEKVLADPARSEAHLARRERTGQVLAEASAEPCTHARYTAATQKFVAAMKPSAVVLAGNSTDWGDYSWDALEALMETIWGAPVPLLGIGGGHELIGFAYGADWGPIGPLGAREIDPDPSFAPGQRKESGISRVRVDQSCRLFEGLGTHAEFAQAHHWELQSVPLGFRARARGKLTRIQAIEQLDRPVFGVQFHPDRYDAAHPDGLVVLRNFFGLRHGPEGRPS